MYDLKYQISGQYFVRYVLLKVVQFPLSLYSVSSYFSYIIVKCIKNVLMF